MIPDSRTVHVRLSLPCSHRRAPPHSLHHCFCLSWMQIAVPWQVLQRFFCILCSHKLDPAQSYTAETTVVICRLFWPPSNRPFLRSQLRPGDRNNLHSLTYRRTYVTQTHLTKPSVLAMLTYAFPPTVFAAIFSASMLTQSRPPTLFAKSFLPTKDEQDERRKIQEFILQQNVQKANFIYKWLASWMLRE